VENFRLVQKLEAIRAQAMHRNHGHIRGCCGRNQPRRVSPSSALKLTSSYASPSAVLGLPSIVRFWSLGVRVMILPEP